MHLPLHIKLTENITTQICFRQEDENVQKVQQRTKTDRKTSPERLVRPKNENKKT